MFKLEIIVREERLKEVIEALEEIGYPSLSIDSIEGRGQQKGLQEQFRGRAYTIPFLPKKKIEVLIREKDLERVKEAVIKAARTGEPGDGKIFVTPVVDVIRICTGETGESAI
ncbi:nitrogen regulatory protein P-II [Carboxydothermus islandicus]|uniref:Nitrogen regulatory protein P-II n=1 Tax=Carboxydothermus islandicus TaxID=661089 RepID=A0A1L8CZP8_9THEO|nr:P-II family nitrogen regulator [Carboxydothermus islandicus]GAV24367.1 nitrogen regulatory protein P-II [Carboxydothermus islandicus]